MHDESGENENEGRGNAGGMIGLTALVALVAVGLLWGIASRRSSNQAVAGGLDAMFAEIQQSADAAAASSPRARQQLSLRHQRARQDVRFHIVVHNDDTLDGITPRDPSCGSRTARRSPAARTTNWCRSPEG